MNDISYIPGGRNLQALVKPRACGAAARVVALALQALDVCDEAVIEITHTLRKNGLAGPEKPLTTKGWVHDAGEMGWKG
jgi:hypothetical protein